MKILRLFVIALAVCLAIPSLAQREFRHPGLSVNQADIDRMKAMYEAKAEPFYTGFTYLNGENNWTTRYRDITRAFPTATNSKTGEKEPVIYDNVNLWLETFGKVAFNNALVWLITGNTDNAERARTILNKYKDVHHIVPWGTNALDASKAYALIEAAELLRSYSGWTAEEQQGFKDFLTYPAYSNTVNHFTEQMAQRIQGDSCSTDLTIYWNVFQGDNHRHGNQGLYALRTLLAIGVFLDNDTIYDRAYNKLLSLPCRKDDIPFPKGPCKRGSYDTKKNTEYNESYAYGGEGETLDYGANDELQYWIYENGQSQESSRDQGHILDGMQNMSHIGRIMWNQGDDFLTKYDNRVLKGFEYTAKYCYSWLNNHEWNGARWTEPDFEPTVENGQFIDCWSRNNLYHSIKINPYRENLSEKDQFGRNSRAKYPLSLYMQYKVRLGTAAEDMVWLQRALDVDRDSVVAAAEAATESVLQNDLLYYRTEWMAGDGVTGFDANKQPVYGLTTVPGTIKAANYDSYPDALNGNGHTYYNTVAATTNDYRAEGGLPLTKVGNDYAVTGLKKGAWMNYTFKANASALMTVKVKAKVSKSAKVSVAVDNGAVTTKTLDATDGEYQTLTLGNIAVEAGARVMRLSVNGNDDAIELLDIVLENAAQTTGLNKSFSSTDDNTNWYTSNGNVKTAISTTATNGTVAEDGHLVCSMPVQKDYPKNGVYKYRGDIMYGTAWNGDNGILAAFGSADKYLAVKFLGKAPVNPSVEFTVNKTTVYKTSAPTNSITTAAGNTIYYYDLTTCGTNGKDSGTLYTTPSAGNINAISYLCMKVADVTYQTTYKVDWIKTFSAVPTAEECAVSDDASSDYDEAPIYNEQTQTSYTNLLDAVKGLTATNQTLTLRSDVNITSRVQNNAYADCVIQGAAGKNIMVRKANGSAIASCVSMNMTFKPGENGTLTFDGGNISVGYPFFEAGDARLTLENCTIQNCISTANTGVINVKSNKTLSLRNCKFTNCSNTANANNIVHVVSGGSLWLGESKDGYYNLATDYTLKIGDAQVATLVLPCEATIPSGIECYKLNYTSGNSYATAEHVTTTLPANTPVYVKGTKGDYKFSKGESFFNFEKFPVSGALTGVYDKTTVPEGSYILWNGPEGVGFYKSNNSTVSANRAYLTAEKSSAKSISIVFDNEATSIKTVNSEQGTVNNVRKFVKNGQLIIETANGTFNAMGQQVK